MASEVSVEDVRHLRGIDRTLRASAVGVLFLIAAWLLGDILLIIFAAILMACVLRGGSYCVHRWTGLNVGWNLADQLRRALQSVRSSLAGQIPGVASSVLGVGGTLIVVSATGLFLAASPETYVKGGLRLLPRAWRQRGREVAEELGKTLQLWFLGQLLDMLLVTALLAAGLLLLGVPLAPTLALFAGLLNFVPYVGALVGAVPAIVLAFAQSPMLAVWVAMLFGGVQLIEGNVIAPLIQRRTVSLPPALTILSQTVLGTLFGAIGLVLATPLTAAGLVAVRMIYVESVLENDSIEHPPEL
jgi:predicted PurR-regulated permease PerM